MSQQPKLSDLDLTPEEADDILNSSVGPSPISNKLLLSNDEARTNRENKNSIFNMTELSRNLLNSDLSGTQEGVMGFTGELDALLKSDPTTENKDTFVSTDFGMSGGLSNLLLKSGSNIRTTSEKQFWESQGLAMSNGMDSQDLLGRGYGDDSKNLVMNSLDMDDMIDADDQHDFIDQNKLSIMRSGVKTGEVQLKNTVNELDQILAGGSNSQIKIEGLEEGPKALGAEDPEPKSQKEDPDHSPDVQAEKES